MKTCLSLILVLLGSSAMFAAQSLQVTTGPTQYVTATPFAAGSNPYRWEARVSGLTSGMPSVTYGTLMMGGVGVSGNGGANTLLQIGKLGTGYNEDTWTNPINLNNTILGTDVLIRIQRDTAKTNCSSATYGCYVVEVCPTIGGTCQSATSTITALDTSWANGTLFKVQPGIDVAFIRGFSTTVAIGTPIELTETGDVVDYEFEGGLTESVHGWNMTGGTVTYVTTPTYPPRCDAGVQQTFRAGYPGTLDGSASRPLDGGNTLTYLWQQATGSTSKVRWTGQNAVTATVRGMTRGPYNFTLNLVDGSGVPNSCTVHNGAVATDENDVISLPPSLADFSNLIGPMIRPGSSHNPWPWADNRQKYQVDVQVANMDSYYTNFFDTAAAGTITVTNGDRTVTGVGTHFTTDLCQGPTLPSTPKQNAYIIPWWNAGANRRALYLSSCTSDTELEVASGYDWNRDTESGLSYSVDVTNQMIVVWQQGGNAGSPASANYYDAQVGASYTYALRSEIDTYWTAARTFADRFFRAPQVDKGQAAGLVSGGGGSQAGYPGRCLSALGMIMRALDGQSGMFTGMRRWWDGDRYYGTTDGSWIGWGLGGMWDEREQGYLLMRLALCGLYETDSTEKTACKVALVREFTELWKAVHDKFNDYSFPFFYGQHGTISGTFAGKTVSVVNGSNVLTLDSGTWTTTSFTDFNTSGTHVIFWPTSGTANPPYNSEIEPTSYMMKYTDSTHATLLNRDGGATTYSGPADGSRKFGTYAQAQSGASLGWTTQPYMRGIIAQAMELAAQALYDADYDPTTAASYRAYALATIRQAMSDGWRDSTKGLYYFVDGVDCPVGSVSESYNICLGGGTPSAPEPSRAMNAEMARALMFAYLNNGQPSDILTWMDLVMNSQFAKPGTCGGSPCSTLDNHYQSYVENGIDYAKPNDHLSTKIAGQMWGVNPQSSWPAIRAGGGTPAATRTFPIGFSLAPGDTSIRFTITGPSGVVGTATCTTSPCSVSLVEQQGQVTLGIEHLDGSGNVRYSSTMGVLL